MWKLGIFVPALSGVAVWIQSLTSNSQLTPPPLQLTSLKTKQLSNQDLEELRVKQEANSAFEKLDDYTFQIFSPCNVGTGWVLDYQLPKKQGGYPLIWYIATNAHVVEEWLFNSNPYHQKLPINEWASKWKVFSKEHNYPLFTDESCILKYQGFFDINLSKQADGESLKSNWGAISQNKIKNYELFWVATNLFDENSNLEIKKNNYKDFAVIEIEFVDEKSAREITRNFADKYTTDSANKINLFSDPLDIKAIGENENNFYSLGYPIKKDKQDVIFNYTKNWNESRLRADRLSRDLENWYPTNGVKLRGHVSSKRFANLKLNWGKEEWNRMGHFYLLEGTPLGVGSSGSMVIDGSGNLIGVRSISEEGATAKNSASIPLRSNGLVIEGNFKTPQYDLILGAPYQKNSYRQQVEKFLKPKGVKTLLSSMGWKSKS